VSPSSTFSPFTIAATTTLLGSPRRALSRFLLAISVTISTRAGFSIDRRYCPPTLRATVHLVHLDRLSYPIESHLWTKGKITDCTIALLENAEYREKVQGFF